MGQSKLIDNNGNQDKNNTNNSISSVNSTSLGTSQVEEENVGHPTGGSKD